MKTPPLTPSVLFSVLPLEGLRLRGDLPRSEVERREASSKWTERTESMSVRRGGGRSAFLASSQLGSTVLEEEGLLRPLECVPCPSRGTSSSGVKNLELCGLSLDSFHPDRLSFSSSPSRWLSFSTSSALWSSKPPL